MPGAESGALFRTGKTKKRPIYSASPSPPHQPNAYPPPGIRLSVDSKTNRTEYLSQCRNNRRKPPCFRSSHSEVRTMISRISKRSINSIHRMRQFEVLVVREINKLEGKILFAIVEPGSRRKTFILPGAREAPTASSTTPAGKCRNSLPSCIPPHRVNR